MLVGIDTLALLISLACFAVDISQAGLLTDIPKNNPLGIDWYPAPPPEDGPPLSAGASRDKSLLPIQISSIVGAYLFCVCVIGIGLFFAGRRNRRALLNAERKQDIEMVEGRHPPTPTAININPPLSPLRSPRNFSRPAWSTDQKSGPTPYVFPGGSTSPRTPVSPYSPQTPASVENPAVDTRIVERDQHMLQRDLEDIYAHVMEQESAKAAGVDLQTLPPPAHLQAAGPIPPAAPQRTNSPPKKIEKRRPSNIAVTDSASTNDLNKPRSRASSIVSALMSPKRSSRKLRISSPIASPTGPSRWDTQSATAEENEPLTPRYYAPAPPPPVPKDQAPSYHTRQTSDLKSPTMSIAEQLGASVPYKLHTTSSFHRQNSSKSSYNNQYEPQSAEPQSAISVSSNTPFASTRSLPLRQFESSSTTLPLRQFDPPTNANASQETMRTTVLERLERQRGMLSPGMKTPGTAGAVPYSPYQPFTPMIPITPRLVTREERKMKERMERKLRSPTTPKEMVKSEDDLWDSGY